MTGFMAAVIYLLCVAAGMRLIFFEAAATKLASPIARVPARGVRHLNGCAVAAMNDAEHYSTIETLISANEALKRELAKERAAHAALRTEQVETFEKNLREVRALRRYVTRYAADEGDSGKIAPSQLEAVPIAEDMYALARELAEYSPDELETLKTISEVGREADIIEAAVRTLIFLLPQVKLPGHPAPSEKMISYFSSIVRQLEETLAFLLDRRDYDLASIIVRAYHLPVDPAFWPRLLDATRKASSREVTGKVVSDMRKNPKGSPIYQAAYAFLSVLDREATTTLLEILAVEKDRAIRRFLIDILKDLAKDQP